MRPPPATASLPSPAVWEAAGTMLVAATALVILLGRTLVVGSASAVPSLAVMYLAVGAISLSAPASTGRPALVSPVIAMVAGTAFVAAVWAIHPSVVPRSTGLDALGLNTLAAVSEEAFFRGFLYGRLSRWPIVAVVIPALVFAAIHVPVYGPSVFWVDLGAGLLLGWQRWASGTWTVPAATHAVANILAVLR